jgi:TolB-like protein
VADLLKRVTAALADRYEVLNEIGRGGMATVYLAADPRHQRRVAIKVLNPDLSAIIGVDRFLREITIAAGLVHPHILPLYDSGEADGLLYYVMPFVEGESLRHRLDRETQLPVEEALRLIRDVAAGLMYAHEHGIVHRDIKPENILLSGHEALIADFGIARAVADGSQSRLTQTGMAIGTASYMSPEQALGKEIDGRSDLYSLACLLYEMLSGDPPFTGPTYLSILAQHSTNGVPSLRSTRSNVPPHVERAIERSLQKLPADRFASVAEFSEALVQPELTGGWQRPGSRLTKRTQLGVGLGLLLLGAVGVVAYLRGTKASQGSSRLDPAAVVVLPFTVSGALDTSLVSSDGVVELLYTRLSGEGGGLHAVYPAAAERAWRHSAKDGQIPPEAAVRLARDLGAGQVLLGRILGDRSRVILSASLLSVPSGQEILRAEVPGPPDSLLSLLDQLAARILIGSGTQNQRNLQELTTGKLSALRPYLAGLQKYRRGQYREAASDFSRALQEDSTFALAALALGTTQTLAGNGDENGLVLAWAQRDRLNPVDRKFLTTWLGPNYPKERTLPENFADWEQLVDSMPDRWEASYQLGEMLFHDGALLGKPAAMQRARTAFRRSLEGDSAFAPALEHLLELAAMAHDTAEARRIGALYLSADSMGDNADYIRWRLAVAVGDTTLHRQVMAKLENLSSDLLAHIAGTAQLDGVAMEDGARAIAVLRSQPRNQAEVFRISVLARQFFLNRGQLKSAAATRAEQPRGIPVDALFQVIEALFWDGDSVAAAAAVAQRAAAAAAPPTGSYSDNSPAVDQCTIGLWHIAHGEMTSVAEAIKRINARIVQAPDLPRFIPFCGAVLEADLTARQESPNRKAALARLDSLTVTTSEVTSYIVLVANLTSARLHEADGDLPAALAAVRRRVYFYEGLAGLSTLLKEEGRLAALTGDTEGAKTAYQHYLALRSQADPALAPEVEQVRQALNR